MRECLTPRSINMHEQEKRIPEKGDLPIIPLKRKRSLLFLVPITVSLFLIITVGLSVYIWGLISSGTRAPNSKLSSSSPSSESQTEHGLHGANKPTFEASKTSTKPSQPPPEKTKFSFMYTKVPPLTVSRNDPNFKTLKEAGLLALAIPQVHYDLEKGRASKYFGSSQDNDHEKQDSYRSGSSKHLRLGPDLFKSVASHCGLRGFRFDNKAPGAMDEQIRNAVKLYSSPPPLVYLKLGFGFHPNFNFDELVVNDEDGNKYIYKAVAAISDSNGVFYRGQFETEWTHQKHKVGGPLALASELIKSAVFTLYLVNDVWVDEEEMKSYIDKYKKYILS